MKFPKKGTPREEITARMQEYRDKDARSQDQRLFSLVYFTRPDILEVAKEAYNAFFSENALNPMAFPSLRRMETEVVGMTLGMLHAPEGAAGTMSSGGSESLLLAVKTARDWARAEKPNVTAPEMILPMTAHPALLKAAHTVGIKPVLAPTTPAFTVDIEAVKRSLNDNTILLVGSAPQYAHGVLDPIADLGRLAEERGILCHVDACIGGFVLPWVEKLGYPVQPWDFRVKGVTSISADLHKYGYAAKGASAVLYRSRALRKHQFFAHGDWPGGLFASPSILGTRPGGAIAAAWAVMSYLGEEGYLELTRRAMAATRGICEAVRDTPGLHVIGEPVPGISGIARDTPVERGHRGSVHTRHSRNPGDPKLPANTTCILSGRAQDRRPGHRDVEHRHRLGRFARIRERRGSHSAGRAVSVDRFPLHAASEPFRRQRERHHQLRARRLGLLPGDRRFRSLDSRDR
jgi:glutamate/tyrosine decarboxylase-like PLP-dependent enzyme